MTRLHIQILRNQERHAHGTFRIQEAMREAKVKF